jgi:hypothetical protein
MGNRPIRSFRRHGPDPSAFKRKKPHQPCLIGISLITPMHDSLISAVCHDEFTSIQGKLKAGAFGLQHRLLADPMAKEEGTLALALLPSDQVRFRMSKEPFCKFEVFDFLTDLFKINPYLESVGRSDHPVPVRMSQIEQDFALLRSPGHKSRLSPDCLDNLQCAGCAAAISAKDIAETAVRDNKMVSILLESEPLRPLLLSPGEP